MRDNAHASVAMSARRGATEGRDFRMKSSGRGRRCAFDDTNDREKRWVDEGGSERRNQVRRGFLQASGA